MKRISVGIDVDDVLSNFIHDFTALCAEMHGISPDTRPVDWEWSNYNLTPEQLSQVWARIRTIPQFWYNLPPKNGASYNAFRLLDGAKKFYITDRFETAGQPVEVQTARFIKEYMGDPYPTVIVGAAKGPVAAALGLDYFIDDRPKNCLEVLSAVPTCKVFIHDSTHNRTFHDPQIQRVNSFDEFARIVALGRS